YWFKSAEADQRELHSADPVPCATGLPQAPSAHREQLRESGTRKEQLFSQLRVLLGSRLGMNPTTIAGHTPFLEMGADSIVLIDAVRMIEQTFGIKLPMRQLFAELSTLDALVDYLDRTLPPTRVGTGVNPLTPTNSVGTVGTGVSSAKNGQAGNEKPL